VTPTLSAATRCSASDGLTCRFRSCRSSSVDCRRSGRTLPGRRRAPRRARHVERRPERSHPGAAAGPHRHRDRGGAAGDRITHVHPFQHSARADRFPPISPTTPSAAHSSRGRSPSSRPAFMLVLTLLGGALLIVARRIVVALSASARSLDKRVRQSCARIAHRLRLDEVHVLASSALALSPGSWSLSGGISVRF